MQDNSEAAFVTLRIAMTALPTPLPERDCLTSNVAREYFTSYAHHDSLSMCAGFN